MADEKAFEIVMRQIEEAMRAGDLSKFEDAVTLARALGALPQANAASGLTSSDLLSKASTGEQPGGVSEVGATQSGFGTSQHSRGRAGSPNGSSQRKEAREQGKLARQSFFSTLSANGINVTHTRNREYRTSKGKHFIVTYASEDPRGDMWFSDSENLNYDVIVFLCRAHDGKLLDFVVPWLRIAPHWSNFSRSTNGYVKFNVKRKASGYALDIPHRIGFAITSFLSNLAPLQG